MAVYLSQTKIVCYAKYKFHMYTQNGYNAYIHHAGTYVVTFTLGNGDEYYGEFDVVD